MMVTSSANDVVLNQVGIPLLISTKGGGEFKYLHTVNHKFLKYSHIQYCRLY